jgi:hypothetical protein
MIHAFGFGSHHEVQKLEVKNAVETLNSVEDGFDTGVDMESIMSVDTAFHCVPVEGQEGEYALQHTDITMNSRKGDDLEPDLPSPVDYADPSDVDMWNLPSSTDDSEQGSQQAKTHAYEMYAIWDLHACEMAYGRGTPMRDARL